MNHSGIVYAPTFLLGAVLLYGPTIIDPKAKTWPSIVDWRELAPLLLATLLVVIFLLPTLLQLGRSTIARKSLLDGQLGRQGVLNGVPLFAKRTILFSCEDPRSDQELMLGALQAYYAEDPRRIDRFCQE